jgi:DNA mismatch repair protein MutS2
MPARVVERARALLDEGTRQITELSERLEIAEAEAREAAERVALKERELVMREKRLAEKESDLLKRRERLETEVGQATRERLKLKEGEVKGLIAALQEKPNLDLAGRSLQRIREIREELKPVAAPPLPPEPSPQPLVVGEKVQVRSMDRRGEVVSVLGKDRYEVNVGGLSMRLKREEVLRLDGRGKPIPEAPKVAAAPIAVGPAPQVAHSELQALRMDANTLDLRGQRAEEALEACTAFFARMRGSGCDAVFVLHGHGTGVLKKAVRDWLPGCGQARAWRPCYPGEGGDAYTLVGLV